MAHNYNSILSKKLIVENIINVSDTTYTAMSNNNRSVKLFDRILFFFFSWESYLQKKNTGPLPKRTIKLSK